LSGESTFFFQLENEVFVLLLLEGQWVAPYVGRIFAVVGMPQANLLFLAGLLEQVAMPFL
jgi:hypothetical protein